MPARIPILYVILGVLVMISVVPMYFYSAQVESINRDRLITNERLLQNTVTRSLADDISQHQESLKMMLANLSSAIQVASGGDITSDHVETPELRALLENFVSSSNDLAYATLLNSDGLEVDATVLDVSGSGFRLQVLEKLYIGELVSLRVDDELVPARIKWVLGDEAGGTFLAPIDPGTL